MEVTPDFTENPAGLRQPRPADPSSGVTVQLGGRGGAGEERQASTEIAVQG